MNAKEAVEEVEPQKAVPVVTMPETGWQKSRQGEREPDKSSGSQSATLTTKQYVSPRSVLMVRTLDRFLRAGWAVESFLYSECWRNFSHG